MVVTPDAEGSMPEKPKKKAAKKPQTTEAAEKPKKKKAAKKKDPEPTASVTGEKRSADVTFSVTDDAARITAEYVPDEDDPTFEERFAFQSTMLEIGHTLIQELVQNYDATIGPVVLYELEEGVIVCEIQTSASDAAKRKAIQAVQEQMEGPAEDDPFLFVMDQAEGVQ